MSLNCNEIDLILSELSIEGTFIQEIVQSTYDTVIMRLVGKGAPYNFLLCTAPGGCRINRTSKKLLKTEKPLRFGEFLKKNVQGLRINYCRQLGLDRILKFDISTWKSHFFMYARLWSNAANIIVTDDTGVILDCMYRRPGKGEVTGGIFLPAEPILTDEERAKRAGAFPVRARDEKYGSFNGQIDAIYTESQGPLSKVALLDKAEKHYEQKKSKMETALKNLLQKRSSFANAESLRHAGDLILTYANLCEGTALECEDYDTGCAVRIPLNPALSPEKNAQVYYARYKQTLSALPALERDIAALRCSISLLDAQHEKLLSEENPLKIEQLLQKDSHTAKDNKRKTPGLRYEVDGWTILVGRSATENDELLRHAVKGRDLWLHTRDYAGGYVFIKARAGKTVSRDAFLCAQNLALYHSKARKNGKADLYCTEVRYLRRAKNGSKGLVIPTQEKNIYVTFDQAYLDMARTAETIL